MDKAALQRSGDSKEQDNASTKIVLGALGMLMRRIAKVLLALVGRGKGEPPPQALIQGLEHFDVSGISQAIADAVAVFTGGIPLNKSKTAYTLYVLSLFRKILGDSATDENIAQIRDELEEMITAEQLAAMALPEEGATGKTDDDGGDGDEKDDDKDAPPKPPKLGSISSKPMKK